MPFGIFGRMSKVIVIYHSRGAGAGRGPVDYLLGKNRDREGAEVKRGNPDQTLELIDSNTFARKYTSGVLSFEEENIPEETKNKIMDDFEKATFCGMDHDQYDVLWVEHRDKDRLELNFLIPNVELQTGRRFQPYFHQSDKTRISAFRNIQNIRYGLTEPINPEKYQKIVHAKDLNQNKKENIELIHEAVKNGVKNGRFNDRNDIMKALEKQGFEIARTTPSGFSIKDPEGGRNIRFKGVYYAESGRYGEELRTGDPTGINRAEDFPSERLARSEKLYRERYERKSEYHAGRYKRPYEIDKETFAQKLDSHNHFHRDGSLSSSRPELVSREENSREISATKESKGNDRNIGRGSLGNPTASGAEREIHSFSRGNMDRSGEGLDDRGRSRTEINHSGGVKNDRSRNPIIESLGRIREGVQGTVQRFKESVGSFRKRIAEFQRREQKAPRRERNFGRKIESLDRAIGTKEQEIRRSRYRSPGIEL